MNRIEYTLSLLNSIRVLEVDGKDKHLNAIYEIECAIFVQLRLMTVPESDEYRKRANHKPVITYEHIHLRTYKRRRKRGQIFD